MILKYMNSQNIENHTQYSSRENTSPKAATETFALHLFLFSHVPHISLAKKKSFSVRSTDALSPGDRLNSFFFSSIQRPFAGSLETQRPRELQEKSCFSLIFSLCLCVSSEAGVEWFLVLSVGF